MPSCAADELAAARCAASATAAPYAAWIGTHAEVSRFLSATILSAAERSSYDQNGFGEVSPRAGPIEYGWNGSFGWVSDPGAGVVGVPVIGSGAASTPVPVGEGGDVGDDVVATSLRDVVAISKMPSKGARKSKDFPIGTSKVDPSLADRVAALRPEAPASFSTRIRARWELTQFAPSV